MEDRTLNTRVILVRHGESTYNVERRVQGHCDLSSLTERGQAGARQVAIALNGLAIDAAYSSPLQRAKQTAEIILSHLESSGQPSLALSTTDNLKEINLMLWEGMAFTDVQQQFPELYAVWRDRPHELCMEVDTPDGTQSFYPVQDLFEQAARFWQDILPQHIGQTLLVVAHSMINRALISTAMGLSPQYIGSLAQANCSVSVLNFPAGWGEPAQLESMNLTAHLGDKIPQQRAGQKGLRLLLVRHGETEWNRQKRFQGQIDVPLNATGEIQARDVANYLKDLPLSRAVTSPLLRPKQTAEAIVQHHPHLTLETHDGLVEISHGLWEGKLEAEIEAEYSEELKQWQRSPETVQMPEGENLQQVWVRSAAAWDEIVQSTPADSGQEGSIPVVLVVAHDAVNKAILCHLMNWGPDQFWRFKQGNGAVSVIDYPKGIHGRPILAAMNITTGEGVLDRTAAGAL